MRISLCVIAGNEAEHIVAMLSSFKHFFDEFALVRAIGAKEPDATIELATVWCRENGKVKAVDYNATIALLIEAVKEQQKRIDKLETLLNKGN